MTPLTEESLCTWVSKRGAP